jgi:predicted NBD/HSP70 family sugar kinase
VLAERWGSDTAHDVFAAAARGDDRARALLSDQARALAIAIRVVQALLDPALIVLAAAAAAQ